MYERRKRGGWRMDPLLIAGVCACVCVCRVSGGKVVAAERAVFCGVVWCAGRHVS